MIMNRHERRTHDKTNKRFLTKAQLKALKEADASVLVMLNADGSMKKQIVFTSKPLDEKIFGPIIHTTTRKDFQGKGFCDICNKLVIEDDKTTEPCSVSHTYFLCESCTRENKDIKDFEYPTDFDLSNEPWYQD
jgi:purine nucleoside phosphorylase